MASNFHKLGVLLIIIIMAFFIHIFYYIAWMLTDHWLAESSEPSVLTT